MKYRLDPRTGNKLSVLSFGCMRFPTKMRSIDQAGVNAMINAAIKGGINYFDTAYIYPGSEAALGRALSRGLRKKVYIATKLPIFLCKSSGDFDKFFNKSLERLQTDYVDYYLMHMIQDLDGWKRLRKMGIESWIKKQKKNGRIRQLGFSFHGSRADFLTVLDSYDWDFCQIQYNYVDENNQAGKTGLLKASEKKIPVVIMEPLLGGKLAGNLPKAAKDIFNKANSNYSPAAWAFRWLYNQEEVSTVLSGMSSMEQLKENIRIANESEAGMFTDEDTNTFSSVLEAFNDSFKVRCTGCGYCMPCPFGVDIPTCFAAYNASFSIGKITGMQNYIQNTGGLTSTQHYASLCKNCGKCEKHCPQSIAIRKSLKEVEKHMEPFWFKPAMTISRKFMGVKKLVKHK